MAYAASLKIFEILRLKFDEPQAKTIASAVETAVETALETNNSELFKTVATKKDISDIRVEMREMKAELIKWMFIFWIGQFASVVGVLTAILFAFFKR